MQSEFRSTMWTRVEEAAMGHDEALRWLVDAYYLPIHAVVKRFLRRYGRHDAEELADEFVQNAFLKMLSDPALLAKASRDHGEHFRAFMTAMVKNMLQNDLRHHRRREAPANELDTSRELSEDRELEREWLSGLLSEAIERLRKEHEASGDEQSERILVLSMVEEMAPKDVAKSLGIKAPDVSRTLYRCRLQLRELVSEIAAEQQFAWRADASDLLDEKEA